MTNDFAAIGRRVRILSILALGAASVVLGRAFWVQVVGDPRLERMARRQFQGKVLISPRRGSILDRNGEALAVNVESSSLAANPGKLRGRRSLVRLLSHALDIPAEKISSRLREKREFIWLKRHLAESELNLLKKSRVIAPDGDLPDGLWLVRESKRVYPHHELAAHVLGDTNVDNEGLEGAELWFNKSLKGRVVSIDTTKDALGRPTFLDAAAAGSVRDGEPVRLTIDASLQYSVQQELKGSVERTRSRGGTAIVMNAVNGEILAMANEPAFDPNLHGAPPAQRRNRAITDGFEPGSTFKPVLLASALSSGMKLSDVVWGNHGSFTLQGRTISEAEAHEKFEWISLKKMIQVSSNVGAAKLALKVGADPFLATIQSLGFGLKSGLGFPGEISGRVPPRKSWQPLTLANIGFGQGVLVTPLQMTRAYAAFLNGGWLVEPLLTLDDQPDVKRAAPKRVFPAAVADQVVKALSAVTEKDGTGGKAVLEGYHVAGKTGTAQTVDPNTGRYSRSRYIASFIGFATGVEPRLVIFTSLDSPTGVYYASETAAPLFRNVLKAAVNRFSIPSDPALIRSAPEVLAASEADVPVAADDTDAARLSQAHPSAPLVIPARLDPAAETSAAAARIEESSESNPWVMPSVVGLTSREALRVLQGRPFEIEIEGRGVVRQQHPEAGKTVANRTTIRLSLSAP